MIDTLRRLFRDPVSCDPSSARVIAFLFALVACIVALFAVLTHHETAATAAIVTALAGGGAGSILSRTKAIGANNDAG